MVFILMYPAVAGLAMFIVGVIMILLRFGPQICGVRHHALPDRDLRHDHHDWSEKAYDQQISYA